MEVTTGKYGTDLKTLDRIIEAETQSIEEDEGMSVFV